MPRYQVTTLVDITRTNPSRSETDELKLKQQANFNSLMQAIGIRSNLSWDWDPKFCKGVLPAPLEGKANHWQWEFFVEREDIFLKNNDPVGLLLEDLHQVPIVDGLNNSVELEPAVFQTQGSNANIWINKVN